MFEESETSKVQRLSNCIHGGTWFASAGRGKPVILIHGVGLDHDMWKPQVMGLKKNYRVITYDMLGHGNTTHILGERFLGDFVQQLYKLLINMNLKSAAIVGFSMGGIVARQFATQYPEMTTKLVLMNTVFRRSKVEQEAVLERYLSAKNNGFRQQIDPAIKRWFSPKFTASNPETISKIISRLKRNDKQGYLEAYKIFATVRDPDTSLQINCPTLIVTGELDSGSTPQMAQEMSKVIVDSEVKILTNLQHMTPVEDPEQINQILLTFFNKKKRMRKN